jgi:hypothetical protein
MASRCEAGRMIVQMEADSQVLISVKSRCEVTTKGLGRAKEAGAAKR